MRWGVGIVIACMVAACDDYVVIEVRAPTTATTSVQLIVGVTPCYDPTTGARCPGLAPPRPSPSIAAQPLILPGDVYYREGDAEPVVRTAKIVDGVARFQIQPNGADLFDTAIAFDRDGSAAAIVRGVSLDSPGIYRVELEPTLGTLLGPKPATTSGLVVEVWNATQDASECMGFERWHEGNLIDRIFIAPETNLDCDRIARKEECSPYIQNGLGVPAIEDVRCTTNANLVDKVVCKLGGTACSDNGGATDPCTPSDYCVPSSYCNTENAGCGPDVNLGDPVKCLFETTPSSVVKCVVYTEPAGDVERPCRNDVFLDLAKLSLGSTVDCTTPYDNLLVAPALGEPLQFDHDIRLSPTADRSLRLQVFGTATCKYKFYIDGEHAPGTTFDRVFADLWMSRSGGTVRKLLLPVTIETRRDATCPPSTCDLTIANPGDLLSSCLP